MAEQDACPHLDSTGEVTKEDLLQKSKVCFIKSLIVNKANENQFWTLDRHPHSGISFGCRILFLFCYNWCSKICTLIQLSYLCKYIFYLWLQGTCQSCEAGGPNLWACLQVQSWHEMSSYIFVFLLLLFLYTLYIYICIILTAIVQIETWWLCNKIASALIH